MAVTIPQGFLQLRQNLEITDLQRATVSTRQTNIRSVIEGDLIVKDSFLTGSYSRNTMIAPLKEADVDIFVVLDVRYFHHYNGQNGGQAGLLDLVKKTLRKTYTRTPDLSRNGQAVTIRFEDFVVDVVPGFYRQGGGFLIPNSLTQSWISTNPKEHVRIFSEENQWHQSNFVPLLKMIKGWNRQINRQFHSFHLEVMAYHILKGVQISDFPSGMRYLFDKGRTFVAAKNLDPAGYGGDVSYYIDSQTRVAEAVGRFETAYDRALNAEHYAKQGYIEAAFEKWRQIFGEYFPAYG